MTLHSIRAALISLALLVTGLIFVLGGGVRYETVQEIVPDPDTYELHHHARIVHHHSHTVSSYGFHFQVPPWLAHLFRH